MKKTFKPKQVPSTEQDDAVNKQTLVWERQDGTCDLGHR